MHVHVCSGMYNTMHVHVVCTCVGMQDFATSSLRMVSTEIDDYVEIVAEKKKREKR